MLKHPCADLRMTAISASAYLACGIADGSIMVLRISQLLEQLEESVAKPYSIKTSATILETRFCASKGKSITAMTWVDRFTYEKASSLRIILLNSLDIKW